MSNKSENKAAEAPKAEPKQRPVVAVHKINGTILPGTIFVPANRKEANDLERLGATRPLTDAEGAVADQQAKSAPKADADVIE